MTVTKRKKQKRKKIIVFAVLALALGGLSVAAFLKQREVIVEVETEKVQRRNLTETVLATGRIQPVMQVIITPEVSGEIVELAVREGDWVEKGALLVRIKADNYIASTNSAYANFMSAAAGRDLAEANLEKARLDFARAQSLHKQGVIPEADYLDAQTTVTIRKASLETAIQQVHQADAALDRTLDELSKTVMLAPMAGSVTRLKTEQGERVVGTALMSGTEIMTIADLNAMEARVDVGERDVILMAVGQVARLEIEAFRDRKFTGLVSEIANAAKAAGAGSQEATKFEVKIRVQEQAPLRPGMSVTAEIETRYQTNVLAVPTQCVTTRAPSAGKKPGSTNEPPGAAASEVPRNGGAPPDKSGRGEKAKPLEVVFIVADGRAKQVPVRRGISDDRYTEITDGLEDGQEVVSGNYSAINRDLKEGAAVRVVPKNSPL